MSVMALARHSIAGGWKSGLAADIAAVTEFDPQAVFGSLHRTCLSALVTDRAMKAW
jgi:hypothetical protein